MKAAVVTTLGGPPSLGDFATPAPARGETIVEVMAASIKQLDRAIVGGRHYASPGEVPYVAGTDGVARTSKGPAYFAVERAPYGAMAELAPAAWLVPLPENLDPILAAAIVNPALGAWLPLKWRGRLRRGEAVVVIGATGASGRLAVAAARLLGAGRVVAAGRRGEVLASLDVDATIDLVSDPATLKAAFAAEARRGIGVVVDYVWGAPAEAMIAALTGTDLHASNASATRLVSVGGMAAPTITLPSAALRASRLEIIGSGTANFPPRAKLKRVVAEILTHAAAGRMSVATREAPLADVARIWAEPADDRRIVLRP